MQQAEDEYGDQCLLCGAEVGADEPVVPGVLYLLGQEPEEEKVLYAVMVCTDCTLHRFKERVAGWKSDVPVPLELAEMNARLHAEGEPLEET